MGVGKNAITGLETDEAKERLMIEATQKDPARFAELYEDNFERLYVYIVRRARDRDEAEDVTSEVFHRARLKDELERRAFMAAAEKSLREGFHTITPYLIVREARELIEFVKQAFGGEELLRATGSAGSLHAEVRIGNSILALSEAHGPYQPMQSTFFLYVDEVDSRYRRAIEEGAVSLSEPADQPYGDRVGVRNPFGNVWYIATHIAKV